MSEERSDETKRGAQGPILAIVLVSYLMILLDNSVIFTALPSLQHELTLSATELAWVQDAYTLVFGGLLLLGARAGDILGRRPVFIGGLIVFSVASLLVSVAPAAWWIIAARALQGVGAAIVAPTALSLITATFQGRERARAVAWYAATAGIGASLGLVVGGALASALSWRAGFFVNVPIGLAMTLLAPRYLPAASGEPGRFDLAGAVTSTLGVGSLVFAILSGAESGWMHPVTLVAGSASLVVLVAFVLIEARAAQPILPLRLFAHRARTGAYLTRLLYLGAMIGFFFFTSQYLQNVLGFSPLQAGLAFLPMTLVNFGVALAVPWLSARIGDAAPLVAGVVLTLGGMLWLSRIGPDSDYLVAVALPMLAIGAGQGLAFAPLTSFGLAGAQGADAGAASGAVNTFHQIGSSLGLGVLVALAAGTVDASAAASVALSGGAVLLAIALGVVLVLIVPRRRERGSGSTSRGGARVPSVKG